MLLSYAIVSKRVVPANEMYYFKKIVVSKTQVYGGYSLSSLMPLSYTHASKRALFTIETSYFLEPLIIA
jgi:hypothetical protein